MKNMSEPQTPEVIELAQPTQATDLLTDDKARVPFRINLSTLTKKITKPRHSKSLLSKLGFKLLARMPRSLMRKKPGKNLI